MTMRGPWAVWWEMLKLLLLYLNFTMIPLPTDSLRSTCLISCLTAFLLTRSAIHGNWWTMLLRMPLASCHVMQPKRRRQTRTGKILRLRLDYFHTTAIALFPSPKTNSINGYSIFQAFNLLSVSCCVQYNFTICLHIILPSMLVGYSFTSFIWTSGNTSNIPSLEPPNKPAVNYYINAQEQASTMPPNIELLSLHLLFIEMRQALFL